jgi:AP-1 complex subunit sigma 1/2
MVLCLAAVSCSYASLYFVTCVDKDDNELLTLEIIHHFVEVLDRYFGNVCELDIIFNFHKVRACSLTAPTEAPLGSAGV